MHATSGAAGLSNAAFKRDIARFARPHRRVLGLGAVVSRKLRLARPMRPARVTPDPRVTRREDDYGSPEVPESWTDEWLSGNPHIEEQDPGRPGASASSPRGNVVAHRVSGHLTEPVPGPVYPSPVPHLTSGVMEERVRQSLAGGLGARDAPALEATSQAAEPADRSATEVGEAADVGDVE
ncbi:hypothetical protein GPECTOR_17g959 [Gonium pectorale]|uniref:Uncharacterized protein n=1 Tax=Gonium pectorale TaxID=33097 RepID=A0A150GLX2_GONPE|nr:hypothetical protein GPECTOR_17g959 [Gonium pectorale]|eukprot:KXZ50320.1 hypothetical protein GPECTOR_17g959 [Gonium pectorale]